MVIGGLISATVLTLILLPILYDRFALPRAARARLAARHTRPAPADEAAPPLAPKEAAE